MSDDCVFCAIARGTEPASIVDQDRLTLAFIDLRQFHPGHTLIIPRHHYRDIREADPETCAALMMSISRIARAVGDSFPNQGLSIWHSIGEAAFQEVPHLHFHVHPRLVGDGFLRIYPHRAAIAGKDEREKYAEMLRASLDRQQAET